MNRIDRIAAILIHLQSRRIVKAVDLAERFEISLRTVYRDIRTLEEAGVPITGEPGVGYSIMQGYHMPPVMFNRDEITALLTAEKLAGLLTDSVTEKHLNSAMIKIRAVLGNTDKAAIESLDDKIAVLPNPYRKDEWRESAVLKDITSAIENKHIIEITYYSNHSLETNIRRLEPIGLWFQAGRWHLVAWCQLRNDYRNFRIDRITDHQVCSETFKTIHPKLDQFIRRTAEERDLTEVILSLDAENYKLLGDQKLYMGFVSQKKQKDKIEITFLSPGLENMAKWILMTGPSIDIVKPKALKDIVRQMAEAFITKFKVN
ncbi:MAG: YafY family transcriptional regulator [Bacteroidetes bacterium]|nr:YafY family transcriptional regulator [Bacteroidota bacterium]